MAVTLESPRPLSPKSEEIWRAGSTETRNLWIPVARIWLRIIDEQKKQITTQEATIAKLRQSIGELTATCANQKKALDHQNRRVKALEANAYQALFPTPHEAVASKVPGAVRPHLRK